jgi:tetratricopeptide (TPR) repeat protein
MNLRLAELWEKAERWTLVSLAFLLPTAFFLKTYDALLVKELLLLAGSGLALAFAVSRAVELGRFELPANRALIFSAAAAWAAWSASAPLRAAQPAAALFDGLVGAAGPLLFALAVAGPASFGFAAALADAVLAAGAAAGLYALIQAAGLDPLAWRGAFGARAFSTLGSPEVVGIFAASVVPLAVCRSLDRGRAAPFRLAAKAAGLLSLAAAAAAGSPAGIAGLFFAALGGAAWHLLKKDKRLTLEAGLAAAVAALAAGGWAADVLRSPAVGPLAWLLAGTLAGLALERGASIVRVFPIPAPPSLRRVLYAPALALVAVSLAGPAAVLAPDVSFNSGLFHSKRKSWDKALEAFEKVPAWHRQRLSALYASGGALLDRGANGDAELALARFADVEAVRRHFGRVDFQKARAFEKLARWDEAADSLKEAVRLEPGSTQAYEKLAEDSTISGRKQDALDAALKLTQLEPSNPDRWQLASKKYRELGNRKMARAMLDHAEKVRDVAELPRQ